MFEAMMKLRTLILVFVTLLLFTTVNAQDAASPAIEDSINQLQLTPEQRQRIRTIFEQNKAERQTTNRRLREAQLSLTQALDTEPIDERVIDLRVNELAAAQAAQLRMRIQIELKIRGELSPEQLATWRRLRLQMRDFMETRRPVQPRRNVRPR
jgi:Spy/CpxP family protein refolding chaperone